MKVRWSIAVLALALCVAFSAGAAMLYAQEHHEHHWDAHNPRFDDHEHVVVNNWWAAHHEHPVVGFRVRDRLPAEWESQLRVGFLLDAGWRTRLHRVPADLLVELPPPPPHYRYYVVGGHVVLVDRGWHVADVISINL